MALAAVNVVAALLFERGDMSAVTVGCLIMARLHLIENNRDELLYRLGEILKGNK